MKQFFKLIFIIAINVFVLSSCNKSTSPNENQDSNVQSAQDNALIDAEFSSIFSYTDAQGNISFSGFQKNNNNEIQSPITKSDLLPECATVTVDTVNKILTINFGTTNCLCKDGNYRLGVVTIALTGQWKAVGSKLNITLSDYYVNDMLVQGSKEISIISSNEWSVKISNASITTQTGIISWNANRTFQKIAGIATPNITLDDVYLISGTCTGTNRKGVNFSVTTVTPLRKEIICTKKDFVSGILTIINLDKNESLSIDYDATGTQSCDKLAKVIIGTKTYTITLR